jgi:hypothetical protein
LLHLRVNHRQSAKEYSIYNLMANTMRYTCLCQKEQLCLNIFEPPLQSPLVHSTPVNDTMQSSCGPDSLRERRV